MMITVFLLLVRNCIGMDVVEVHLPLHSEKEHAANHNIISKRSLQSGCVRSCAQDVAPCNELEIQSCQMECVDACKSADIRESTVECQESEACFGATIRQSTLTCTSEGACSGATVLGSAIDCVEADSCMSMAGASQCSCCTSEEAANCPDNVPLCNTPETVEEFCQSAFLGRTCQDWGNPLCESETDGSFPPVHSASTCTPFQADITSCERGGSVECEGTPVESCTVDCIDACQFTSFTDSTVHCTQAAACSGSSFFTSAVICGTTGNSCDGANFIASTVTCAGGASCNFLTTSFDECSCCTGAICVEGVLNCEQDQEELCGRVSGSTGRPCANPVCAPLPPAAPVAPPMAAPTEAPPTSSASPSLLPTSLLTAAPSSGAVRGILLGYAVVPVLLWVGVFGT